MKNGKKILALLLTGAMVASLAACGSKGTSTSTPSSTPSSTPKERTKIIISALPAESPALAELRKKYIEDPLKNAFPDMDIEFATFSNRQAMQVQIAGGGGPDILSLDGPTDASEFAKSNRIVDLDAYAEKYKWKEQFFDWAWNPSIYNKKLYSVPNSFEGMVIYYNKDVFTKNGWKYPKNADEMVDVMKKAQKAGIIPISFGNSNYQGAVDWLYSTFLSSYAGPVALKEALQQKRQWSDPLIRGSFEQLVSWWQEGYIGEKNSQSITTDDLVAFFADGKAAMLIDGTWAATELLSTFPEAKWDVELMPELRSGVGQVLPIATGGCYAINSNSKNKDKAAEVINWFFTSSDRHLKSVVEANYQPYPLKSFDVSKLTGMDERMINMYKILMDAQKNNKVGYCSWTFFPSDARVYMNENTDGLFLKTTSIDDYLKKVQGLVDKAVADGTAPALP